MLDSYISLLYYSSRCLIKSTRNGVSKHVRPYEPDFNDSEIRNPWDAEKHPDHYRYIQSIIERLDRENIRPPKYTHETKLEVYRLRDKGFTLRQIAETVGVSKSTACLYLQKRRNRGHAPRPCCRSASASGPPRRRPGRPVPGGHPASKPVHWYLR